MFLCNWRVPFIYFQLEHYSFEDHNVPEFYFGYVICLYHNKPHFLTQEIRLAVSWGMKANLEFKEVLYLNKPFPPFFLRISHIDLLHTLSNLCFVLDSTEFGNVDQKMRNIPLC